MRDILTDILIYISKLHCSWSGSVTKSLISVAIKLFSITRNVLRLRIYGNFTHEHTNAGLYSNVKCTENSSNSMVHILDGNPEIGAHVRSNLCYLTC